MRAIVAIIIVIATTHIGAGCKSDEKLTADANWATIGVSSGWELRRSSPILHAATVAGESCLITVDSTGRVETLSFRDRVVLRAFDLATAPNAVAYKIVSDKTGLKFGIIDCEHSVYLTSRHSSLPVKHGVDLRSQPEDLLHLENPSSVIVIGRDGDICSLDWNGQIRWSVTLSSEDAVIAGPYRASFLAGNRIVEVFNCLVRSIDARDGSGVITWEAPLDSHYIDGDVDCSGKEISLLFTKGAREKFIWELDVVSMRGARIRGAIPDWTRHITKTASGTVLLIDSSGENAALLSPGDGSEPPRLKGIETRISIEACGSNSRPIPLGATGLLIVDSEASALTQVGDAHTDRVVALSFLDSKRFMTAGKDRKLKLWEAGESLRCLTTVDLPSTPSAMCSSWGGAFLELLLSAWVLTLDADGEVVMTRESMTPSLLTDFRQSDDGEAVLGLTQSGDIYLCRSYPGPDSKDSARKRLRLVNSLSFLESRSVETPTPLSTIADSSCLETVALSDWNCVIELNKKRATITSWRNFENPVQDEPSYLTELSEDLPTRTLAARGIAIVSQGGMAWAVELPTASRIIEPVRMGAGIDAACISASGKSSVLIVDDGRIIGLNRLGEHFVVGQILECDRYGKASTACLSKDEQILGVGFTSGVVVCVRLAWPK